MVCKIKCLQCTSIYIGETRRKLKIRLDKHKQDANKDNRSKISGLSSHIKNTGHMIDKENSEIKYKGQNYVKRTFVGVEISVRMWIYYIESKRGD